MRIEARCACDGLLHGAGDCGQNPLRNGISLAKYIINPLIFDADRSFLPSAIEVKSLHLTQPRMKLHYAAVCSLLLGLVQSSLTLEDTILDLSPRPEGIAIKERVLDSAERRDISAQLVVLRGVGMWDLPAFQVVRFSSHIKKKCISGVND